MLNCVAKGLGIQGDLQMLDLLDQVSEEGSTKEGGTRLALKMYGIGLETKHSVSKGSEGELNVTQTRENVRPAALRAPAQASLEAVDLFSH